MPDRRAVSAAYSGPIGTAATLPTIFTPIRRRYTFSFSSSRVIEKQSHNISKAPRNPSLIIDGVKIKLTFPAGGEIGGRKKMTALGKDTPLGERTDTSDRKPPAAPRDLKH